MIDMCRTFHCSIFGTTFSARMCLLSGLKSRDSIAGTGTVPTLSNDVSEYTFHSMPFSTAIFL
jgi:phospholipase C